MLFDKPLRIFIEVLSTWKGYEKYIEPLKAFRKNFVSLGLKSYRPHKGSTTINVLNHGDFHSRNVLFRKDMDGTLSDMIMVSLITLDIFDLLKIIFLNFSSIFKHVFLLLLQLI